MTCQFMLFTDIFSKMIALIFEKQGQCWPWYITHRWYSKRTQEGSHAQCRWSVHYFSRTCILNALCVWVISLWEISFRSHHNLDDTLRDWTAMCYALIYSSDPFPLTLQLPYYIHLPAILMHATCLRTYALTICLLCTWCFECLSTDIWMACAFSSFSLLSYVTFLGTSYLN